MVIVPVIYVLHSSPHSSSISGYWADAESTSKVNALLEGVFLRGYMVQHAFTRCVQRG